MLLFAATSIGLCAVAEATRDALLEKLIAEARLNNPEIREASNIYVDIRGRDIGGYVADAKKAVRENVRFPPGYFITLSGQCEYMGRAKAAKLQLVVLLTLLLIFVLLDLNFRRLTATLIVILSVRLGWWGVSSTTLPCESVEFLNMPVWRDIHGYRDSC